MCLSFFLDFICPLGLPFPLLVPLLSRIPFILLGFVFRGFWFFFVGIGFASVLVSWFFSPLPRSLSTSSWVFLYLAFCLFSLSLDFFCPLFPSPLLFPLLSHPLLLS
jgi:hypothetical protein